MSSHQNKSDSLGNDRESPKARLIAFYLPQFHPIPENDHWWGKGFTEWTNVAKAKPLFPGHHQPHVPADLGFYDLRVPEVRAAQAALARSAGIEGFCYWHYWFAGKRLLERPFCEVVESGEPDYPFCLGWANQTWTGIWHGAPDRILIEQTYPGPDDHERHFYAILPALQDRRHIRISGKPLFLVYDAQRLPGAAAFIEQWQNLARKNGLPGIHFVAQLFQHDATFDAWASGFNGVTVGRASLVATRSPRQLERMNAAQRPSDTRALGGAIEESRYHAQAVVRQIAGRFRRWQGWPRRLFDYSEAAMCILDELRRFPTDREVYPCVVPNWDNSPRSGTEGLILTRSSPDRFRAHVRDALEFAEPLPVEKRIIFVKSWNEWAEGNYLEPDLQFGHQYLEALSAEILPLCKPQDGPLIKE